MKKYTKKILALFVLIILIINCKNVYSAYSETIIETCLSEIAQPIIKLETITNTIDKMSTGTYENEFKVKNYNELGKISGVNLQYTLSILTNIENCPFTFKLYRQEDNGDQTEVPLSAELQTETYFFMPSDILKEDIFKLEIYNNSDIPIENVDISIEINAVQMCMGI